MLKVCGNCKWWKGSILYDWGVCYYPIPKIPMWTKTPNIAIYPNEDATICECFEPTKEDDNK